MANKPNIRFKGFTDEWKKAPLSDYLVVSSERNINNQYTAEDVQSVSGEYGVVNQIEFQGRSFAGTSLLGYRVIHHGEIAYTKSPLKQSPYGIIKANKIEAGIVSSLYGVYKVKNGYANFIQDYFDLLSRLNGYLRPLVNKGAKNTLLITDEDAISGDVIFPNEAEQKEVSKIIESISASITQREKELEKLKNIKRALLEKLFPQNGSKVPALRFKEFAEEWEDCKISDILVERNEQAPQNEDYPLMAFVAHYGIVSKGERYDRSALIKDSANKPYKRTRLGDFIYSSNNLDTGSIGMNRYGNASISPVYSIFLCRREDNPFFVSTRLSMPDVIHSMVLCRQGVTYGQWKIHESDFLDISVHIPKNKEQQKLGLFISKLDELFSLREKQLTLLKHTKQALLEQMFVNE